MAQRRYHDVFVAYIKQDTKWVQQLTKALEQASLRVWFAEEAIRPGDVFSEQLYEALHNSENVVMVLTPQSIHSNWIAFELGAALALGKRIIPVVSSEVPPEALPGPIRIRQTLPMDDPQIVAERIAQFIQADKRDDRVRADVA